MLKILRSEGIMPSRLGSSTSEDDINEEVRNYRNYLTRREPSMRITKKALTVAATWADKHSKPIVLGDIPWQL